MYLLICDLLKLVLYDFKTIYRILSCTHFLILANLVYLRYWMAYYDASSEDYLNLAISVFIINTLIKINSFEILISNCFNVIVGVTILLIVTKNSEKNGLNLEDNEVISLRILEILIYVVDTLRIVRSFFLKHCELNSKKHMEKSNISLSKQALVLILDLVL